MFLQFLWFFLMALLGLIIYYCFALQKFNAETPAAGFQETFKKYFKDKIFATIGNIFILIALTLMLIIDPSGWYIKWLSGGMLDGGLPAQSYIMALFIGLINQAFLGILLGKRNVIAGYEKTPDVKPPEEKIKIVDK